MSKPLDGEKLIPLRDAAKYFPTRPHLATLYRWALSRGAHGVRLETVHFGHQTQTSAEAIERFIERVTLAARSRGQTAPPSLRKRGTTRKHSAEIRRATRRLNKIGA